MLYWDRIKGWNLLSEDDSIEYAGVNPCAEELKSILWLLFAWKQKLI